MAQTKPPRRRACAARAARERQADCRGRAFNCPSVTVELDAEPSPLNAQRLADLCDQIAIPGYKQAAKKAYLAQLVQAGIRAGHFDGTVRVSRAERGISQQVEKAAVEAELFVEHVAKSGGPKMTRLAPRPALRKFATRDPFDVDPHHRDQALVRLSDRTTKLDLPIDRSDPFVAELWDKLDLINHVNNLWTIKARCWERFENRFGPRRQLRPMHFARFSDDFEHHGRLYTGRYGHQALRKIERATLEFNGEPSVELDYGGLHPRLCYHLQGQDYRNDPYRLWGTQTTPELRCLGKLAVNALLNAKSRKAAEAACRAASRLSHVAGPRKAKRKSGGKLDEALRIRDALKATSVKMQDVVAAALEHHQDIAKHFATDAGVRLMRLDGEIALGVMLSLIEQGCPVLGVHDSFLVPKSRADELRRAMRFEYVNRIGFEPVIRQV